MIETHIVVTLTCDGCCAKVINTLDGEAGEPIDDLVDQVIGTNNWHRPGVGVFCDECHAADNAEEPSPNDD